MSWCALLMLLHLAFAAVTVYGPNPFEETRRTKPKQWGLLVAGSNGYFNYRHQADVCHAYQVLHQHGIPDERIVVMMYDDIANNSFNPTPGEIVNHPNGSNVYEGVPKDYTGDDVTPRNFLRVLQGEKPENGSRKVIQSGEYDHVFVYFSDHGAPGMLIFPDSHLHARRLIEVITKMHEDKKYGKLIFFVEACFSGSMFESLLPSNISVYAMTAAHPHELSYACYYDDFRSTWLGDCFSVHWMEYADKKDLHKETFAEVYKIVKNETTTSHVMQYGDMETATLHLSQFMGDNKTIPVFLPNISSGLLNAADPVISALEFKINTTINETRRHALEKEKTAILKKRERLTTLFINITKQLGANESTITTKPAFINYTCYEETVNVFSSKCLKLSTNPFVATLLHAFANLCSSNLSTKIIVNTLESLCAGLELNNVV